MNAALDHLWILTSAALVMSMQAGFCMLEAGLVRSKNSINVAIKNLMDFCVAAILFWAFGYGLMFGKEALGGWIGSSTFLVNTAGRDSGSLFFFIFQLMFCATAATIVSGAVAERMSFSAYLLVTAVISGIVYPIGGGWAWNEGGWLRGLGFRDFAGSSVVHSVGGWVALAAVFIIGPRTGRFDSKHALVSSHSLVISTLGVIILYVAWLGFNGGSTLAFDSRVPGILINTALAGAAGCLSALAAVWWHRKLPELPATLNGCVGGLVAVTAACNAIGPAESVLVGAVGGAISYATALALEAAKIDDVVGASAAHAAPGIWGTLAVGLLGDPEILGTGLGRGAQIGVQALGVAVYFLWAFCGGYGLLRVLNHFKKLRIRPDFEEVGLNVAEHGASTEIIDLLNEMARHSYKGEFSERLSFEPYTEVGQIASQYNRVIDKVVAEMELRENIARHLQRARDESENANRKIFSSLQYARRIQHAMLPTPRQLRETLGDHFVLYEPRDLVSGDFYWCASAGGSRFCAVVDCTGHGVPGAFMSMIGYLLLEQTIVERGVREPAAILSEMHTRVRQALAQDSSEGAGNRDGMEVALVRIDPDAVVFAGAQRPLWWFASEPDGSTQSGEIPGDRHGLGGGIMEPPEITFTQHTIPRRDDLTIYLQSDGLVQQPNHLRSIYDRSRLRELLESIQSQPISTHARAISTSFHQFRGGAKQRDDVTIVGLRPWRNEASADAPVSLPATGEQAPGELFSFTGPIDAAAIEKCGRILREGAQLHVAARLAVFGIFVELAQNVARHSDEVQGGTGVGTIFARHEEGAIVMGSTNRVTAGCAEDLRARFAEIAAMDAAQLKDAYLQRLHDRNRPPGERGLGLIDLSRKSLTRPEVHFTPISGGKFLFSITVRVRQTSASDA